MTAGSEETASRESAMGVRVTRRSKYVAPLSMMIQSQPLDMRAARARASSVRGIRPAGSPVFDEVCSPAKEECCKEHCESVLQSTGIRSGDAERGLEGHDGQQ